MDSHNNKRKRHRDESTVLTSDESTGAAHLSRPIRRWQRTLLEIRKDRCFPHLLLRRLHTGRDIFLQLFHVQFQDTCRRVVREELHKFLHNLNLPPQLPPDQTIQARYWLVFLNKVENPTFTTNLVRDENGDPIKVAIYDTYAQSIISPDCFLSSAKVRLTVLDAEFWENKGETWSRSDFNQSVLRERERKGPILIGPSLIIQLQNGHGTFQNIVFNDNSSWTKSGFQLGVMIEGEGEEGYLNGERIREGLSEPFRVKDRRGKENQKPVRLELKHNVRSLKNIGKDRASLLENNNIKTVSDFLWWYYHNQAELRKILGIKSNSNKDWIIMVEHAKECDNEFCASYNGFNNTSQPQEVLMEKQINILSPNFNPIPFVIDNNANQVSPLEEAPTWMVTLPDQFGNESEALVHPMGRNMSLCINAGPRVVGSGSSEPNPFENDIIEGDMPAIYGQLPDICDISSMNVLNEHISTASGELILETQQVLFHETNHTARGNIVNVNSMQSITGDGLAQPEIPNNLVRMEEMSANTESTSDNILQSLSRSDSFDPDMCEVWVQEFIASLFNSGDVRPQTPRRKRKMKALVRSVAFVAVIRKLARIVPPAK
jgi:hypothetical protein